MNKTIIIAFFLAIAFSSCFQLFGDPTTELVKSTSSNNKTKKAVLLLDKGNATVGFSLQVSILKNNYQLKGSELGNTFVVDANHGATPLDPNSVNFTWLGNDSLKIDYDIKLRTFKQDTFVNGTVVVYKPR